MSDWYDKGLDQLLKDSSEALGIPYETVSSVYCRLSGLGLIDYDIEKDIIWEMYGDEEEVEEDE